MEQNNITINIYYIPIYNINYLFYVIHYLTFKTYLVRYFILYILYYIIVVHVRNDVIEVKIFSSTFNTP